MADSGSKAVAASLYHALNRRDAAAISGFLAADLEWWFHGPPSHQFLMRILTAGATETESETFQFVPSNVAAFGCVIVAEGYDARRSIAWVHAWTLTDGKITQVREYFNTSLTVTRLGQSGDAIAVATPQHCSSVWESTIWVGKSVPGLVLAL